MSPFRPISFIKDSYIAEYASPTVTYHGFYTPSDSSTPLDTSTAIFLIAKETKDGSGNTITMKWSGNIYNKIWNNRGSINFV
jgi:hypothetical protein